MSDETIRLKIVLPYKIFVESDGVTGLVAPTVTGAFGILPHRQDCVVAISPGILTYREGEEENHVALDAGILVKKGLEVSISVRNAVGGAELGKLRESVEEEFSNLDEQERGLRLMASRLETSLVRKSVELQRE